MSQTRVQTLLTHLRDNQTQKKVIEKVTAFYDTEQKETWAKNLKELEARRGDITTRGERQVQKRVRAFIEKKTSDTKPTLTTAEKYILFQQKTQWRRTLVAQPLYGCDVDRMNITSLSEFIRTLTPEEKVEFLINALSKPMLRADRVRVLTFFGF